MRHRAVFLSLCAALGLAGPARAACQALPPARPAAARASADSAVALKPGDVVRLRIWREPDLSGDFAVDENGVAVFPKIGAQSVVGDSPEALRAKLVSAYDKYLLNPSIDVTPLRRVNILGAVKNPGLYPIDPTMAVADAIALAGGATSNGVQDGVEIVRGGQRMATRLTRGTRIADTPLRSGDQLYVPERRWISRNAAVAATVLSGLATLILSIRH